MAVNTNLQRTIEESLGRPLRDWLGDQHEHGLSYRAIARKLADKAGIHVSYQAVANWIKEFGL